MKTITISTLELRNFKGCQFLRLDLEGRSCNIYGDNAAGKTTVYDALTWLLFGKDSGGSSKFNIKPLTSNGDVLDHAAETSVKAELDVDGEPVTIERTYFELWSKKRGSRELTFDGHSSNFFYNGLPVQKNEFSSRINMLCDETTFRTLTDLRWFCAGESEANRRAALFDLIGGVSEADVLASDSAFEPLEEALHGLTVEEFKRAAEKQRRGLNTKAKTTPARIDECKRTVTEYESLDFDSLRSQRETLAAQTEQAQLDLNNLRSQSGTDALMPQRDGLKMQLEALEQQNAAHRTSQQDPARKEMLEREANQLSAQLDRIGRDTQAAEAEKNRLTAQIERCREDWKRFNAEMKQVAAMSFTPGVCPHCGQALPRDQVEAHRQQWEEEQQRKLNEAQERRDHSANDAKRHKERIAQLEQRVRELHDESVAVESRQAQVKKELKLLRNQTVTDLSDYAKRKYELTKQLNDLEEQIGRIQQDSGATISAARQRFNEFSQNLKRLDGVLAGEAVLNNAQARMQELQEEQKKTAEEMERLDGLLDLCDLFTRAKAEYIDQRVNGMFQLVEWQLFEEQINGGLRDCCKATVDGVPYADLNNGAKINAGVDVIATLSAAKGIRVPLFVDNAESVTQLAGIDTQVIRLVVSEGDKALRVEME